MSNEINFPKTILSERKLKATSTRIALLQLLYDFKSAVPFSKIQKTFSKTDRITLYRTMQTLLEKGIIHKALHNNQETYYALCGSNCTTKNHSHNHAHFKCTECQAVTCEQLKQEVLISLPHLSIQKIDINLTGVCNNCM